MNRRTSIGIGWLLAAACTCAGTRAWAQDSVAPELDNHAFRLILNQSGLHPLHRVGEIWEQPERTVLIIFGRADVIGKMPTGLKAFVEKGGAALVATDRPTGCVLGGKFRILLSVSGTQVRVVSGNPSYGDSPDCPFVEHGATGFIFDTNLPVATNRPSTLGGSSILELPTLAWLSNCAVLNGVGWEPERRHAFAIGGNLGKGRLLVLADHSIFINGMMLPRELENGNMQFAYNCVRWLKDGTRDRVLFIDEGQIETDFDVPIQTIPDLPLSPVQVANVVIAAAEKENLFNQYILDNVGHRRVLRTSVIVVTAALLAYGVFRLMRNGFQFEPRLPSTARAMAKLAPVGALPDRGDFWEAGRDLARDTLSELGYTSVGAGKNAWPRVRINGTWWQRHRLPGLIRHLRKVGRDKQRQAMSRRHLDKLIAHAEEVRNAARQGILTIES